MTETPAADRRAPRVLIADDDPATVKFLTDRCVKMGLIVQTASNGTEALSMARQDPPDALIVDVHMPEVDGLSLCSRMLDPALFGIDIIVMSGYSDAGIAERCESFGATYVRKGADAWLKIHFALHRMFPDMTIEARGAATPSAIRERPLILVVDDDPNVGRFLTTRLRKCGADVVFATDGKHGYQIAVREKPNVILSDYFMSVANINFLLWRLRSTPGMETIPVFAMTGLTLDSKTAAELTNGQFGGRGVEGIFKKPLDIDDIFTTLQQHCALAYKPAEDRVASQAS